MGRTKGKGKDKVNKPDMAPTATTSATTASGSISNPARLGMFESWMTAAGISWDTSLITLNPGTGTNTGAACSITATADVPEGARLCAIPKTAILSRRSCGIADILEAERLGGGLGLIVAVMYEAGIEAESKWHGYFSSLPTREYLPIFWTKQELKGLEGTEMEGVAEGDKEAMQEEFDSEVLPLLAKYPGRLPRKAWNLEAFRVAASWVVSRSFHVDDFHGDAMVPLADVFNHKAAVIAFREGYEVAEIAAKPDDEEDIDEGEEVGGDDSDADEDADEDADVDGEGEEVIGEGEEFSSGVAETEDSEEEEPHVERDSSHKEATAAGCKGGKGHVHSASCTGKDHGHAGSKRPVSDIAVAPQGGKKAKLADGVSAASADAVQSDPTVGAKSDPAAAVAGSTQSVAVAGAVDADVAAAEVEEAKEGVAAVAAVSVSVLTMQGGGPAGGCGSIDEVPLGLRLEIAICDLEPQGEEVLHILCASAVPAGSEVHNTYGEHGNSELLHKYGFALMHNPFSEVSLAKSDVLGAASALMSKATFRKRCKFLQIQSELLDEEAEPFLLLPGSLVSIPLYVALNVLLADDATFASWASVADALPQDQKEPTTAAAAASAAAAAAAVPAAAADATASPSPPLLPPSLCQGVELPAKKLLHDSARGGSSEGGVWSTRMCDVLRSCVAARLERYATADVSQEEKVLAAGSEAGAARSEHATAVAAAALLRLTEKHLLLQALKNLPLPGGQN